MVSWGWKCLLVLYKHLMVRKRHYILTIVEILLPVSLALLVAWFKRFEEEFLAIVKPNVFRTDLQDLFFPSQNPMHLALGAVGFNVSIIYTPDNSYTQDFVKYCYQQMPPLPANTSVTFYGVEDEENITEGNWPVKTTPNFFLVFDETISLHELPKKFHYRLIVQEEDQHWLGTIGVALQHVIALHFMREVKGHDVLEDVKFTIQSFPMQAPVRKGAYIIYLCTFYFGYLMPFCFIFTVPVLVTQIVMEKQRGIKELMRMMGLPIGVQWFGYFVNSFVTMFISSTIIVLMLTNKIFSDADPLIKLTGPEHLIILFTLYILCCISFCFFLSTLCQDATRATLFGILIWCMCFMIPFLVTDAGYTGEMSLAEQVLFCLAPNMGLYWGLRLIAFLEQQDGLKWEHYYKSPTLAEDLTFIPVILMFLVDIILYWCLGWYFDQLFPGTFGVPQPWNFLFKRGYWPCFRRTHKLEEHLTIESSLEDELTPLQRFYQAWIYPVKKKFSFKSTSHPSSKITIYEEANFENEPDLPVVVEVASVTKVFKSLFVPPFVAVHKVTLNAYRGEILVILGHNGAGKTVTLSMITGLYSPTSGNVYINGYSIQRELSKARNLMGFCPQGPMFFPELTVIQHFWFFGMLKGMQGRKLDEEVERLLCKLKLWEEKKKRGSHLSGGMLRRLQMGIAAIGESYLIILDEPTSGLDPEARRLVWDLLLDMRSTHCVLLTTHNMEEADALGDRIAILSHGQVVCCGTPMFLRNRFGATYMMKVTKSVGCKVTKVLETVRRYVSNATIDSNTQTELSIILPANSTKSFPDLFRAIESNLDDLKITSFGLSTIGLEEIFLKANLAAEKKRKKMGFDTISSAVAEPSESAEIHLQISKGIHLCWQRFCALMMKRVYYTYHRVVFFLSQFLIIVFMSIVVLAMVNEDFDRESVEPVLESVFDPKLHTMVFLSNSTVRLCLPDAYVQNIPEHVTVRRLNSKHMLKQILDVTKSDIVGYHHGHYVLGAQFISRSNGTLIANALYCHRVNIKRSESYFKLASLNLVHNAVLQNCHKTRRTIGLDIQIRSLHETRKRVTLHADHLVALRYIQNTLAAVLLCISLSLICASFVYLTTQERITQAKHMQLMTGTSVLLFWGTAFLFDFMFYLVCISVCVAIVTIFAFGSVMSVLEVPVLLFGSFFLFGFAAIPFSYLVSLCTKSVTASYVAVLVVHMFCVVFMAPGHEAIIMYQRKSGNPVAYWYIIASVVANLLPGCCVTVIVIRLWLIALLAQAHKCWTFCSEYLATGEGGVMRQLCLLALSGIFYILLLLVIEIRSTMYTHKDGRRLKRKSSDMLHRKVDRDVEAEYDRVQKILLRRNQTDEYTTESSSSGGMEEDVLLVDELTKCYTSKTMSVDHLTFGVGEGECFGLLGVNGAGKTTTFRMLTGTVTITSGNAYMKNTSLLGNSRKFLSQVGYCPQFDALVDHLTGRETLLLFANLRGIKRKQIKEVVDSYLRQFGLSDYAYKITANYSLGTKRRLSAAMAFLGVPTLVMMDEPTTGVDPASRRKIWEVILTNISRGASVLLTSHSMDECEVLCTRLAIMKKGRLKCIGAVQHLKAKFGKGFKVYIKLPKLEDQEKRHALHEEVEVFMKNTFTNCIKRDDHEGLLEYSVSYDSTNWQTLFTEMEQAKVKFGFEDYSVSQATLEQVFMSFASDDD